MVIDQSKLNRQNLTIDRWWGVNAKGAFVYPTGTGKTYVILMIIKRMTDKFPSYRTTIVVPSRPLKEAWEAQVEEMNLPNVKVYVVNTYVGLTDPQELQTELLAADEIHHYCSEDAEFFNKAIPKTTYKYFIGASATLEAEELRFLASCGIALFDTVTEKEAEDNGWIAKSLIYNLVLPFTDEDRDLSNRLNQQFKVNFAKFEHSFGLMMACSGGNKQFKVDWHGTAFWQTGKEWREWWANEQGYTVDMPDDFEWSPKTIIKYAITGTRAMKERKELLYNIPSKNDVVLQLIDKYKDKKIIVFCETQKAADALQAMRPSEIKSYHSNLETITIDGKKIGADRQRKLIVQEFESVNGSCRVIACVRALDEGFNVEAIEIAILHSYNSKKRRDVQRRGRAGRIDYDNLDKVSLAINFCMENSQELKWLKLKQRGAKKAIWVTSIDDISLEQQGAKL